MTRPARRLLALTLVCAVAATAFAVDPALKKQAKDPDSFKRSDAARALAKEGSADAAAIVAELLADRNAYVRDAAVVACADLETADAVEAVAKAASSKDELTRRNVAAALGRTKHAAALATLAKLARKDPSAQVRAEALDALWGFQKNPDALATARDGAADADAFVRAAAVEAAGRIGGDGAAAIVRKAIEDPDEGVRCVARMEMRYVARDEASAVLASGAADASWRIRAQTVDDAAWLRDAPAMDALVKLVGDAVPRVSGAAHHVLRVLSGKDLGRDADLWKAWWDANRAGWKAPRGRFEELKDPGGDSRTTARYHGLEITSDHVAFVIDFSGSMKNPLPSSADRPRVEIAREELLKAVAALPDGARANVVLFQVAARRCFDTAPALNDRVRKDIESFLRATPGERGNLLEGVLQAVRDDAVDTVFLLSDGAPSAGDLVDKQRVQAAIRQVNRTRKVAIHTIAFGAEKATERAFMDGVARDSGGRSVAP
jgi:HEAT repeat protein